MIGARLDALLYRGLARRRERAAAQWPSGMRWFDITTERLRLFDSGGAGAPLVFLPAGPCSIEHYATLTTLLRDAFRVVIVELPGVGFSAPAPDYAHSLHDGGGAVSAVLQALSMPPATLVASSVNGFYALAATHAARARIDRLMLCQTPSLAAMQDWATRMVPPIMTLPVVGQLLNYNGRRRIATAWCRTAVADRMNRDAFARTARDVLRQGGCYCHAGVMQGMRSCAIDDPLLTPPADLPVGAVWGQADRSHPRSAAATLHSLCPQAEMHPLEGVGHFPELEAPEAFATLLRAGARTA